MDNDGLVHRFNAASQEFEDEQPKRNPHAADEERVYGWPLRSRHGELPLGLFESMTDKPPKRAPGDSTSLITALCLTAAVVLGVLYVAFNG